MYLISSFNSMQAIPHLSKTIEKIAQSWYELLIDRKLILNDQIIHVFVYRKKQVYTIHFQIIHYTFPFKILKNLKLSYDRSQDHAQ